MDRAERGCFTSTEARHAIRALLGLPTPPDESGASAIVSSVIETAGDSLNVCAAAVLLRGSVLVLFVLVYMYVCVYGVSCLGQ